MFKGKLDSEHICSIGHAIAARNRIVLGCSDVIEYDGFGRVEAMLS